MVERKSKRPAGGNKGKVEYTTYIARIPEPLREEVTALIDRFHYDRQLAEMISNAPISPAVRPLGAEPPIPRQKSTSTKWPGGSGNGWRVIDGEFQYQGVIKSDRGWCDHFSIPPKTIAKCKKAGMSPFDAFIRRLVC